MNRHLWALCDSQSIRVLDITQFLNTNHSLHNLKKYLKLILQQSEEKENNNENENDEKAGKPKRRKSAGNLEAVDKALSLEISGGKKGGKKAGLKAYPIPIFKINSGASACVFSADGSLLYTGQGNPDNPDNLSNPSNPNNPR